MKPKVTDVRCPTCGAAPGKNCRTAKGRGTRPHTGRVDEFYKPRVETR